MVPILCERVPRLRIVLVLTDAPIDPDPMLDEDLCIHCERCLRACPVHCFQRSDDPAEHLYRMDAVACMVYHEQLVAEHHWPCGICAAVCPVGDDLAAYRGKGELVTQEGVAHCQAFGS